MVSAEVTSEDPQVVEYVVNPDAVWSEGEPIDCDDFYLAWLAGRGDYKQTNPDGSVVNDPETGAEILLFDTQGTTGWDQIPGARFVVERGGEVVRVPMVAGKSTTATVERMRSRNSV